MKFRALHQKKIRGFNRKEGVFTRFSEEDLKAIEDAFAERVLSQLHKQELISDDDVAQILFQDHTGFGVWLGTPSTIKRVSNSSPGTFAYAKTTARHVERAPLSLENLSIQDDIVTYITKDGAAHACLAVALA